MPYPSATSAASQPRSPNAVELIVKRLYVDCDRIMNVTDAIARTADAIRGPQPSPVDKTGEAGPDSLEYVLDRLESHIDRLCLEASRLEG